MFKLTTSPFIPTIPESIHFHPLRIEGGRRLSGAWHVQGSKNEAVMAIAAAALTTEVVTIENVPRLTDIHVQLQLLRGFGARVEYKTPNTVCIQVADIDIDFLVTADFRMLFGAIRGSLNLIAPLLIRTGKAKVPQPGGDQIGDRKLDCLISTLSQLGVRFEHFAETNSLEVNYPEYDSNPNIRVYLPEASVISTASAMMAASCRAGGVTEIINAASEPHLAGLARMLNGMGASISGIGTNQLCVVGVSEIGGVSHRLGSDLIEAGSVIALAGATQSSIKLVDLEQVDLNPMIAPFRTLGISIETSGSTIIATGEGGRLIQSSFDGGLRRFDDAPWPGFPTDLICQAIATSISASGELLFFSRMYERRLAFSSQLKKFGANVQERGRHELLVYGLGAPERLSPTRVYANDIRSSAALLITALSTSGTSVLQESGQLARGHEDFLNRLQAIGACISHCSEF